MTGRTARMIWIGALLAVAMLIADGGNALVGDAAPAPTATAPSSQPVAVSDWPQWRGPQRTGATGTGPALAASWPVGGLTKLWQSEPIPGDHDFGFASPVVAGNRVYQFVSWMYAEPLLTRTLTVGNLKGLRRKAVLTPETLDKLDSIKDKEFANQADLDKWFTDSGIDATVQKTVKDTIAITRNGCNDTIVCLDLANGKTLWKKEYPCEAQGWGSSSTPCVISGKVYASGRGGTYCVAASDGKEIWKDTKASINSSILVVGGVAAIQGDGSTTMRHVDNYDAQVGGVRAYDADTGKPLWTQPAAGGGNSSLTSWEKGGTTYLLASDGERKNLSALELKTGKIVWTVPANNSFSHSSPVVSGDYAVVQTFKGLICYKLAPTKAEQVWIACDDTINSSSGSPVIYKGHVYAHLYRAEKTVCIELETGKVKWSEDAGKSAYSSPIVADGKLLFVNKTDTGVAMLDANPDKFAVLGKANVFPLRCTTPVVADGKLIVRTAKCIVAYDLTATPPSATQPAAKAK